MVKYLRFTCRRALFDIEDQAARTSSNCVDIAELDTLLGKAKSLGQELSDNLKRTNEGSSSEVHDNDYRKDPVLVNETVPCVCRIFSTKIAYVKYQQRTTSAKKAEDELSRDAMASNAEVLSAEPSARSPDAIEPMRSAESSARDRDANETVQSAEQSARSRVASDSVRSVDNEVLNPHAKVFRPHATDLPDDSNATDVPDEPNASDVPDKSNATEVVRASQGNATLNDVSDSKAVNVPTPPEVIATLNFSPTLPSAPTQADVIVLLSHPGDHYKTYSGEWGQAKVVDGTTSESVVMMRDISVDVFHNSPDDVLEEAFEAELDISCALEDTDDLSIKSSVIALKFYIYHHSGGPLLS